MAKGKSKKFINKKNSLSFRLIPSSQKDDENAQQRVLVPVPPNPTKLEKEKVENDNQYKEQEKYGIHLDDGYDYLHLKDVNSLSPEWQHMERDNMKSNDKKDAPKINLPSSLLPSNIEEKVKLLNRAAPISGLQLDSDPDIVEAMDKDVDYDDPENELEDNFIELANAGNDNEFLEEEAFNVLSEGHLELSQEEQDGAGSLVVPQYTFKEEETRSRFTESSMNSSLIRRNKQLCLLDNQFEKVDNVAEQMKHKLKILENEYSISDNENNLEDLVVDVWEKDKWGCESIMSTYSNTYNHPKLISKPRERRAEQAKAERTLNKKAFKEEKKRQRKNASNNGLNVKGYKIL